MSDTDLISQAAQMLHKRGCAKWTIAEGLKADGKLDEAFAMNKEGNGCVEAARVMLRELVEIHLEGGSE